MDIASRAAHPEAGVAVRILTSLSVVASIFAAVACASPGTPPGGPADTQAPQLVRVAPDSGRTNVRPREVVFEFDEVVNERPAGATSLNALFLISPRNGDIEADWHRGSVSVRPGRGFKANTTYTISMLPGMSDLRGNTRNTGASTVFSTGSSLASSRLGGALFNWTEARVIPRGLIEARPIADTATVYVTTADSAGKFLFRNIPPATYRVRGISDDNTNRGLDPREPYDTVIVTLADSARVQLLAFVHDSTGSRLSSVSVRDSVTLELLFDNPLSTSHTVTPNSIRVRGSDSTDVAIVTATAPPVDTTSGVTIVRLPRPAPIRSLIVKLARPLRQKITYRVRVTDVENLLGVARTSEREVTLPPPPVVPVPAKPVAKPPDPTKK